MENNTVLSAEEILTSNEVLKLSALLYFKEALTAEEYERCAELVEAATNFGATQDEINDVITESIRGFKPGGRNGNPGKNRLRSLKETR